MRFIKKPSSIKKLVLFYSQLEEEVQQCSFDTSKMDNYIITSVVDDFLESKGKKKEPSNHLLRESYFILQTQESKKQITDFIKTLLEQEVKKRKEYFETACLLPQNQTQYKNG